ncbi:hypothetical protein V8C26DRAFT_387346 [Trichoderma gracile]
MPNVSPCRSLSLSLFSLSLCVSFLFTPLLPSQPAFRPSGRIMQRQRAARRSLKSHDTCLPAATPSGGPARHTGLSRPIVSGTASHTSPLPPKISYMIRSACFAGFPPPLPQSLLPAGSMRTGARHSRRSSFPDLSWQ